LAKNNNNKQQQQQKKPKQTRTKQKYTGNQSPTYSYNVLTQDKVTSGENLGTLVDVLSTIGARV